MDFVTVSTGLFFRIRWACPYVIFSQTCFRKLKKQRLKGITKKYMKKLSKVDPLILDEFLLTAISECEQNDLFKVIQSRTDKKSTIYCSQ